ncbi:MAG: hypothetical protein R3234_04005 [Thermoanaerobaculia bacterium]|nr:hypothetical protein [Thermoanaerobaculia bacterium]
MVSEPTSPEVSSTPTEPTGTGCGKGTAGCFLGCVGLALLSVLLVAGAVWWFIRPGTQHATTVVVGPESSGAFRVGDLAEDPGARAALEEILVAVNERSPSTLQSDERPFWARDDADPRGAARVLGMLLPKEGTLSFEPAADREEPVAVLALNIRGMTKILRALVEADRDTSEIYRGVTLARSEEGDAVFAMVDGTLLITGDVAVAKGAVDRLLNGASPGIEQRLRTLDEPETSSLFVGSMDTREGLLSRSLEGEAEADQTPPPVDPRLLEPVQRLEIVVDSLSPETILARVGLATPSAPDAERAAAAMAEVLEKELSPAAVATRPEIRGADAILHLEITEWVDPVAAHLAEGDDDEPSPPADQPDGRDRI